MTSTKFPLSIETDFYTSGCLPVLLMREISAVERRLGGRFLAPEYHQPLADYLAQLKAMQQDVDRARGATS